MLRRLKDDSGASVTIYGIFLATIIMTLGSFIIDLSKWIYTKNMLHSYAQQSVHLAIKEQDSLGGLKPTSAEKFVQEYINYRGLEGKQRPANYGTVEWSNKGCENHNGGGYPRITMRYISNREIGTDGNKTITLESTRGNNPDITKTQRDNFHTQGYKGFTAEITDVVRNEYSLANALGFGCVEVSFSASSIASARVDHTTK